MELARLGTRWHDLRVYLEGFSNEYALRYGIADNSDTIWFVFIKPNNELVAYNDATAQYTHGYVWCESHGNTPWERTPQYDNLEPVAGFSKAYAVNWGSNPPSNMESITINGKRADATPEPEPVPNLTVNYNISEGRETHTFVDGVATINITISLVADFITENVTASYKSTDGTTKTVNVELTGTLRKVTGSVVINDVDTHEPVTINGNVVFVIKPIVKLTNCTVDPPLKEYYKMGENFTVRLVADEGNYFTKPEKTYLRITNPTGNKQYPFVISTDKRTATVEYTNAQSNDKSITVYGVADADVVIEKNYGSINAYVVTLDILDMFAKKRFTERTSLGESVEIDLGEYVNRIKRIFTDVPVSGVGDIVCGNYNTEITANKPAVDVLNISFGDITLPVKNGDNTDYESNIQMFVPFVGLVSIDNELTGKKISLEYEINVITGGGIARVKADNIVMYVWEIEPSTNILYRTANNELQLIGSDEWNEKYLYGLEPYVVIKWYNSLNTNERNNDNIKGQIGDFHGFNSFDNISDITDTNMLADEQNEIYELLKKGVNID